MIDTPVNISFGFQNLLIGVFLVKANSIVIVLRGMQ